MDAFGEALSLLLSGDRETWEIIGRSLRISLTATVLALLLGLPVGAALAFGRFRGRRIALALVNTGMGVPPIVAGLVVTILLWRSGPLGGLGLLYTPTAMVIAQTAIALPLVAGFSTAALQHVDPDFRLQMQALGAGRLRSLWTVAVEARLPLLAAGDGGLRRRHLRGRRGADGRRQHRRSDARAHHGRGARGVQGRVRLAPRVRHHPARARLRGEPRAHGRAAARRT